MDILEIITEEIESRGFTTKPSMGFTTPSSIVGGVIYIYADGIKVRYIFLNDELLTICKLHCYKYCLDLNNPDVDIIEEIEAFAISKFKTTQISSKK